MERANRYFGNIKFLYKAVLGYIAYITVFPVWLSPLLQKLRGVKIEKIFGTYIAPNVLIDSLYPELVGIEEGVYITRGAKIITHFNPTDLIAEITKKNTVKKKVLLKKGAFIGINSIILPGVTIGTCAVVGAGAVVTKDVPDFAVVAGNPAKILGDIREKAPQSEKIS